MKKYDVAFSFAGEDRKYVEEVAEELKERGVFVFYDKFEEVTLWGKNLYEYLNEIYSTKAEYTVMFISNFYRDNFWTNHERKSAQEKAFIENREYILPARFDTTEIPGISQTVSYIDLNFKSPTEFAEMICQKIGFNDPENQQESFKNYPKSYFSDSTIFFYNRFADAFPGERGVSVYKDVKTIIERLKILFAEPIFYNSETEASHPFWWFRGLKNLHIESFDVLNNSSILIDSYELQIDSLVAVNLGEYYQCFIYLQTSAQKPSGLYGIDQKHIDDNTVTFGFCREELGIYKKKHLITRAEYDDNGADINGKIVHFGKRDVELRIRYLTPYNFLIAPHNSPINNSQFDLELQSALNSILIGNDTIQDLAKRILKLPKRKMRGI